MSLLPLIKLKAGINEEILYKLNALLEVMYMCGNNNGITKCSNNSQVAEKLLLLLILIKNNVGEKIKCHICQI